MEDLLRAGDVAAVIVEPIQTAGTRCASDNFYRELRKLVGNYDSSFIVNEAQTGCGATGRMWAHEKWGLE